MAHNRFKRGSGCFACNQCGNQTRDTGDNGSVGLCPVCYAKQAYGNSLSDNTTIRDPWDQFLGCKTIAEVEARYDSLMSAYQRKQR